MPVDMKRYPAIWPVVRQQVLMRAKYCCERCGVPNHVYRWGDVWHLYADTMGDGLWMGRDRYDELGVWYDRKPARIVLTIAHVHDPDPTNCAMSNLQALCQRCHNRLDAAMRAKNAAATRRQQRLDATGQMELL